MNHPYSDPSMRAAIELLRQHLPQPGTEVSRVLEDLAALHPHLPFTVTEIRSGRSSGDSSSAQSPLITLDGSVVGTPAFMAPEQAQGDTTAVDHQSDVYSLGAVLYHLLTGQPPYVEPGSKISPRTILARVLDGPPKPVSKLNSTAPAELIAICEKAMARDKTRRYVSADVLAEELQAWLDHRVVRAYQTGPVAEFRSWVRRNRLAAGVAAVAAAALLSAGAWWIGRERYTSIRLRTELAQQYLRQGQALSDNGRLDQGLHLMARALGTCPASASSLFGDIQANLRGWTERCNRLRQVMDHESAVADRGIFSSGLTLAFSPDGTRLITGGQRDLKARIWSIESGSELGRPLEHASAVASVLYSHDGRRIVTLTSEGSVQLWTDTGEPIGIPWAAEATRIVQSRSQSWVAIAGRDGSIDLWSTESGNRIGERMPGPGEIIALAFSADDQRLFTGYQDGSALVWSLPASRPVGKPLRDLAGRVWAFHPESVKMVVVDDNNVARIWSLETGRSIGSPFRHETELDHVLFSPDGKLIATTGDFTARLWSAVDGTSVAPPLLHESSVLDLAFSPDGELLLTGGLDFSARLWSVATGQRLGIQITREGTVRSVAFNRTGDRIAIVAAGRAEVWSTTVLPKPAAVFSTKSSVWGLDFSQDGKSVAVSGFNGFLKIAPRSAPDTGMTLPAAGQIWCARFSPDSRHLAASSRSGAVLYRNDGDVAVDLPCKGPVRSLGFNTSGTLLATGEFASQATVWSVPAGQQLVALLHPAIVEDLVFSHDDFRLITACADGKVRFWDWKERKEVMPPLVHSDAVLAVRLNPSAQTIATGGRDRSVRFWNVGTGQPSGPILQHANWVEDLAYSPDARWLVTACADGNVQVWSVATGERLGPPIPHRRAARAIALDPSGSWLLTGAEEQDEQDFDFGHPWCWLGMPSASCASC